MTPVRVIGTGSPNGSDSLGWQLVDALRTSAIAQQWPAGLLSFENCTLPAQLFPLLNGCRLAILVDAAEGCAETVERLTMDDLAVEAGGCTVHGFGVAQSLQLVERLAEPPPRVVVFGVNTGPPGIVGRSDSAGRLQLLSAMIDSEITAFRQLDPDLRA